MDEKTFQVSMDSFCYFLAARGISHKMNPEVLKAVYYPKFKHFENGRFNSAIGWLQENYSINRFPSIAEFLEAISATSKPKYYTGNDDAPERRMKPEAFSGATNRVLWALTIMKKIEKSVSKNQYERESYKMFIREKMANNEILNTVTNQWQKGNAPRSFEEKDYFNPKDFYPPKDR